MGTEYEKDFDDEVYEDDFYDDNYNEEELIDEDHYLDDDEKEVDDWEDDGDKKIDVSYACEDCDYRWEDVITRRRDELDLYEESTTACPMCGSTNITQI
jgi:DNA-directed RNA polymerase subunit RPC12/RpoP